MALAVVLGASGCCGSIPLSLRCGGSEWASAAARDGRRVVWGVAARARVFGGSFWESAVALKRCYPTVCAIKFCLRFVVAAMNVEPGARILTCIVAFDDV